MADEESLRNAYAAALTEPSAKFVKSVLEALNVDLNALLVVMRSEEGKRQFKEKIHAVEGVLVACLGHHHARARGAAVRMLNSLYDGTDWQLPQAHAATVAFVGDKFQVDVLTTHDLFHHHHHHHGHAAKEHEGEGVSGEQPEVFRVLVSGPAFGHGGDGDDEGGAGSSSTTSNSSSEQQVITLHAPSSVTEEDVWVPSRTSSSGGTEEAGGGSSSSSGGGGGGGLTWVKTKASRIRLTLDLPFERCGESPLL